MTRRTRLLPFSFAIAALGALLVTNSTFAGPNAGGTLILHTNPSLVYCQGLTYCGQTGITSCEQAITRHDGGDPTVFFALAAFPAAASPRLQGIVFSLQYDSAQMAVIDYGQCGDFELHSNDWPGTNSYTGITWNTAQTQHLIGVCWFVACLRSADADLFRDVRQPRVQLLFCR